MDKKICSIILTLVLLISIVGCNSKKTTENDKKPTASTDSSLNSSQNQSSEDDTEETINSDSFSSDTKTETIVSTIPKKERPQKENNEEVINPEYLLENDTTIKDEIKLGKYKYVWGDEFNGNQLDMNKWQFRDTSRAASDVYFTKDNLTVSDGIAKITAKRYYDPSNATYKWSNAPTLETKNTMNYQYGYLEMRACVPYMKGMWPSFWLLSGKTDLYDGSVFANQCGYNVEVDVFEIFGSVDTVVPNLHKWYVDGSGMHTQARFRAKYIYENTEFLNQEYHIYGFEWTPNEMSMYVDGEKYNTFDFKNNIDSKGDMSGFNNHMYLIIGNTIISPNNSGNDAMGLPRIDEDEPSDLPASYCIDWIRLYQEDGKGNLLTKQ